MEMQEEQAMTEAGWLDFVLSHPSQKRNGRGTRAGRLYLQNAGILRCAQNDE